MKHLKQLTTGIAMFPQPRFVAHETELEFGSCATNHG
jgi:hypothetical protein